MERILNTGPAQSSLFADAPCPEAVATVPEPEDDLLLRLAEANAARARGRNDTALELDLHRTTGCDHRLAVYGSLAPGESNHGQVALLGSAWTDGFVRGRRAVRTWPVFTWEESALPVPVRVLTSTELPVHWARLDAFEGVDYRRILVLVRFANAPATAANLYSAVLPVADDEASARNRPSTR